jgi:hypothetical protein
LKALSEPEFPFLASDGTTPGKTQAASFGKSFFLVQLFQAVPVGLS